MAASKSKQTTQTRQTTQTAPLRIVHTVALREVEIKHGMIWQIDDPNRPDGARNVPAPELHAHFQQTTQGDSRTGFDVMLTSFNAEIAHEIARLWTAYCLSPDPLTLPPRATITIAFEDYIA